MNQRSISAQVLPGNTCFGCGQENPNGLQVVIFRDPANPKRLLGDFNPRPSMTGFPGITHGGAIYTALDCMATWSGMVLRKTKAMWLLRSATLKYHRPAIQGHPIALAAVIEKEGEPWEAIEVRAEARNAQGELLAEGNFKMIPVPPDKFKALMGVTTLPEGWANWLGDDQT